jgi:membrane protein
MRSAAVPTMTTALLEFVGAVARRFNEDRCWQIASSLTFTTLLSMVPLATVALTLISAFPVFREMNETFEQFVMDNLMPDSAEVIGNYTEQFRANAGRLTTVGIAFLTATAVMLMVTIERAFNQIWRVSRPRPVMQRAIIYWTLLTVGPVLVGASLTLTSWLISLSLGLVRGVPGAGMGLLKTAPVALTSLALALLYLTMPNRRILLRDALIGGVLAGLVFEATKRGFGWYISQFANYKLVYGAFATVPVFLIWIYISWLIVVLGAVVVALLPERRVHSEGGKPAPGADFLDAMRILWVLWEAHHKGEVVRLRRLHGAVPAGVERIEALLDAMAAAAWVSRAGPDGWVLIRDPAEISLERVYRLFVFSPESLASRRTVDAEIDRRIIELGTRLSTPMQSSIEHFFQAAAAPAESAKPACEAPL